MRKLKQSLLIGLAFILILSSCSMEKRVYMPGYHAEWKNSKYKIDKCEFGNSNTSKEVKSLDKDEVNTIVITKPTETSFANKSDMNKNTHSASSENLSYFTKSHKIEVAKKDNVVISNYTNLTSKTNIIPKNEIKKLNSTKKKKRENDSGGGAISGLLMIILALALIGLGYLFYISLGIFGMILFIALGVGGAIFLIAGLIIIIAGK